MKIATWNVNSLRVRLPHVLDWLAEHTPDVLCLQETKVTDDQFPLDALKAAGYESVYIGQKTFNGVAILSRKPLSDVVTGFPGFDDPQRRILVADYDDVRVVNLYVPNGSEVGSEKFAYKLDWLQHCHAFLQQQVKEYDKVIVVGDFNIAPEDIDVYDPEKWQGSVLVSSEERAAFTGILDLGFEDIFRKLNPEEQIFSWWDYRAAAFRRKHGLRIDLILTTAACSATASACYVDAEPRKLERPSDHAPVVCLIS